MNADQLMLHNAVTNRMMSLYVSTDFNTTEIAKAIQEEINDSMNLSNDKVEIKVDENILTIINRVITIIKANGKEEEWSNVCVATLDYVKSQITYTKKEGADVDR